MTDRDEKGVPKVEIARRLRIDRETVSRVGALVGFPARRRRPQLHDWEAVRAYYEAGHTAEECKRLQLHHVNGDGTDNRLENITFLCGNCHSQTDTYGGRNGHHRRVPNVAKAA